MSALRIIKLFVSFVLFSERPKVIFDSIIAGVIEAFSWTFGITGVGHKS
jgi:hypothetical protein